MRTAASTTGEYTSGFAEADDARGMKNCSIPGGSTGSRSEDASGAVRSRGSAGPSAGRVSAEAFTRLDINERI